MDNAVADAAAHAVGDEVFEPAQGNGEQVVDHGPGQVADKPLGAIGAEQGDNLADQGRAQFTAAVARAEPGGERGHGPPAAVEQILHTHVEQHAEAVARPLGPEHGEQLAGAGPAEGVDPLRTDAVEQVRQRAGQQRVDLAAEHGNHPLLDLGVPQPGDQVLLAGVQVGPDLLLEAVHVEKPPGHGAHRAERIEEVLDPALDAAQHLAAQHRVGQVFAHLRQDGGGQLADEILQERGQFRRQQVGDRAPVGRGPAQAVGEVVPQPLGGAFGDEQVADHLVEQQVDRPAALRGDQAVQFPFAESVEPLVDGLAQPGREVLGRQVAVHPLGQPVFQRLDTHLEVGAEAARHDRGHGAQVAAKHLGERALDQLGEVLLERLLGEGRADVAAGEQVAADHLADVGGQLVPFGRDDPGRHGHPHPPQVPRPQRPEEHADGDLVGQVADEGANAGRAGKAEQGRVERQHGGSTWGEG